MTSSAATLYPTSYIFYGRGHQPDPASFPTRRSSDLELLQRRPGRVVGALGDVPDRLRLSAGSRRRRRHGLPPQREQRRSEEHTSELQSQSNLVCRLLLEKKNTT